MLGIPPDIHEGSHELFISYIHASDREAVQRALQRAKEQRVDFEGEFRSSGIDGEIRWLSGHGRAYYDEQTGRPVRMIGVIRDITERKRFEEHSGRISKAPVRARRSGVGAGTSRSCRTRKGSVSRRP